MQRRQEYLKLVRYFDAVTLERRGYWGCIECSAHNLNTLPFCSVCGAKCWLLMPTVLISIGPTITLVQNQIYALPASRCLLFTEAAAPTIQQSNDITFAVNKAVTLDTNNQAEVAGGWIRCTSGNINVTLKKA